MSEWSVGVVSITPGGQVWPFALKVDISGANSRYSGRKGGSLLVEGSTFQQIKAIIRPTGRPLRLTCWMSVNPVVRQSLFR